MSNKSQNTKNIQTNSKFNGKSKLSIVGTYVVIGILLFAMIGSMFAGLISAIQ